MVVVFHPHHPEKGHPMHCDCAATPEDIAADIHHPDCTSLTGPADDPSDHYGM